MQRNSATNVEVSYASYGGRRLNCLLTDPPMAREVRMTYLTMGRAPSAEQQKLKVRGGILIWAHLISL